MYHFIGIGGVGMSALAHILLQKGMRVSGSDIELSESVKKLQNHGAHISIGHSAHHIKPSFIVIYSSAVAHNNPEIVRAKELGCILWHRSDLLKWLARNQKSIVVAGTHGKTTTTAMLSHVLCVSGKDPSFVFGGTSNSFASSGKLGQGEHFVLEGDESDASLLKTQPFGAIVTNVDNDHLDFWKTKQALYHAYVSFMLKVEHKEHFFWCGDDLFLKGIQPKGMSYGFTPGCTFQIVDFKMQNGRVSFSLQSPFGRYDHIDLGLMGEHNALNAAGVFAMALSLGIEEKDIRLSFSSFAGVKRRLEKKGERAGIYFFDDYAHHPTEIMATLTSLKRWSGAKRLVAVFQPHRYSRTQQVLSEFKHAFQNADHIVITDVFSAGEEKIQGVSGELVADIIEKKPYQSKSYVSKGELEDYLRSKLQPEDVVVTMGAGDISLLGDALTSK
jgi:UDP-N-acetylmuramate--alanine ligase